MTEAASPAVSILVVGFGNPARGDDGLGPAFARRVAARGLDGVVVESPYQLQLEDAVMLAEHDAVIFADAEATGPGPFSFRALEPTRHLAFTSHAVVPGALLAVARDLFECRTPAYVLGIRGHAFGAFDESLSAAARDNLDAAASFLVPILERRIGTDPDALVAAKEQVHVR